MTKKYSFIEVISMILSGIAALFEIAVKLILKGKVSESGKDAIKSVGCIFAAILFKKLLISYTSINPLGIYFLLAVSLSVPLCYIANFFVEKFYK